MLSFPSLAGLIVVREDLVLVLLSEKWLPMLSVLSILGLAAMTRSIGSLIAPLLNAIGRPDLPFALSVINVVLFTAAFFLAIRWGIVGVATAWLVLYPVVYGVFFLLNFARVGLTLGTYAKALTQPLILTGTMVAVMITVRSFFPEPGAIRLMTAMATGLLWYIGFVSVCERTMLLQLRLAARGQNVR